MKKATRKTKSNEYRLEGRLGIWIDGGSDNDYFRGKKLDETFSAPDDATTGNPG